MLGVGLPSVGLAAADLNLFPNPLHVLLNLAIFLALVWPTKRFLLDPLLGLLEARERKTVGALAEAESLLREAAESRERFEAQLAGVHARAEARRAEILGEGETEARELIQAARDDAANTVEQIQGTIRSELVDARRSLRTDAASLANEAAGRILGRAL